MARVKTISILLSLILLGMSFISCSSSNSSDPSMPPAGVMQLPPGTETSDTSTGDRPWIDPEAERKLVDKTWVDPGKIWINNLYLGAKAEPPELPAIRIHHGGVSMIQKRVTTFEGESSVDLVMPTEVTGVNLVESNLSSDNPTISYISGTNVTVTGLTSSAERILTVTFEYVARFAVMIRPPDYTERGYMPLPELYYNWITISEERVIIAPRQTIEVPIYIHILDNTPGRNYEIWISVTDVTIPREITTELCTRWFLNMR